MRCFITTRGARRAGGLSISPRIVLLALALAAPLAAAVVPLTDPVPGVAAGFTLTPLSPVAGATSAAFGPDGNLYVTSLIGEVDLVTLAWTPAGPVATGTSAVWSGFSQPLGVLLARDGTMFVTDSAPGPESGRTDGEITRIDSARTHAQLVVTGLPNGRHNTNNMVWGPDGRLYFGNGNSNDNGIDGGVEDVFPYSGAILSIDAAQVAASPAVLHWTHADGTRIPASQIATDPRNADFAAKVHVLAHGFRNVYDVAFDHDGVAWTGMNGADTPDSQDLLFRIAPGTDYAYPYCFNVGTPGGRDATVVTNPTFPGHDCSGVAPAYALLGWHTCATGIDVPPVGSRFAPGEYLTECGPFQPDRVAQHDIDSPTTANHNTGHDLVRADATGVHTFLTGLAAPTDVVFGPDGAMYVIDAEMVYRVAPAPAVGP